MIEILAIDSDGVPISILWEVVELHVRVALLNRFTQLGRPSTVPVGAMA